MPWLNSLSALYGEGVGTISIIVRTKRSEADASPSHPGAYHHANGRQKETYKLRLGLGLFTGGTGQFIEKLLGIAHSVPYPIQFVPNLLSRPGIKIKAGG